MNLIVNKLATNADIYLGDIKTQVTTDTNVRICDFGKTFGSFEYSQFVIAGMHEVRKMFRVEPRNSESTSDLRKQLRNMGLKTLLTEDAVLVYFNDNAEMMLSLCELSEGNVTGIVFVGEHYITNWFWQAKVSGLVGKDAVLTLNSGVLDRSSTQCAKYAAALIGMK